MVALNDLWNALIQFNWFPRKHNCFANWLNGDRRMFSFFLMKGDLMSILLFYLWNYWVISACILKVYVGHFLTKIILRKWDGRFLYQEKSVGNLSLFCWVLTRNSFIFLWFELLSEIIKSCIYSGNELDHQLATQVYLVLGLR